MVVHTEHTPNPDTLKFLPGKKVSAAGPVEFLKSDKNINIPLVNKIFSLEGTTMVFLGEDFITVKKEKSSEWDDLKYNIISQINDHYLQGNNAVINKEKEKLDSNPDKPDDTISKIKKILDEKIRPAVARDGGDIIFKSFENGIVKVQLKGSCSGCPSSIMTLKQGVQNLLCHYLPEVKKVEAS
tara:strand:+ start:112 stop:663 length:552 start_codon:yes stop_codon:yes gene_type:complete